MWFVSRMWGGFRRSRSRSSCVVVRSWGEPRIEPEAVPALPGPERAMRLVAGVSCQKQRLVQRFFQCCPELRVSCPELREPVAAVLAEDVATGCTSFRESLSARGEGGCGWAR